MLARHKSVIVIVLPLVFCELFGGEAGPTERAKHSTKAGGLKAAGPELPAEVAASVKELEEKIEKLRTEGVSEDDRKKQDDALAEGIRLAEEVLALRQNHQGDAEKPGQKNSRGQWWEVADARWRVETLRAIAGMDSKARAAYGEMARERAHAAKLQAEGRMAEAEPLCREALALARGLFPGDHPDVATSLGNLSGLLHDRGDVQGAESLLREALEIRRRLFPGDHPDIAGSLDNLALQLQDHGNFPGAEPLCREALEIRRRVFPGDHNAVATSLNNLGLLLGRRGDLQGAEPLFREAIEMRRRLFQGDHPDVAGTLNNIAVLLQYRGDLDGAETASREALEMKRRLFPGDHPDIALSLNNLALLLGTRGDLDGAETLCRHALDMFRRLFEDDHPSVAMTLGNLATFLLARGDLEGAEPLFRGALEMRRRLFRADHPDIALSLNNVGRLLQDRGDLQGAEPLYRECMDMMRRLFPGDHPHVAVCFDTLGVLRQARGDLQGAEPLLREALEMRRRLFRADHPDIAFSLSNIAGLLKYRGDFHGAEPLLREALDMRRRLFLGDHPYVAASLNNLAPLLQARGDLKGAAALYCEALDMRRRLFPGDHPDVAASLSNVASMLEARGDLQGAAPFFLEALDMAERLRPKIIGEEKARAEFSEVLKIPQIAAHCASILLKLARPREAFAASERGRARALLDLLERRSLDLRALALERAKAGSEEARRVHDALSREEKARIDLTSAEALAEGLQRDRKTTLTLEGLEAGERERRLQDLEKRIPAQLDEVTKLRRALSEAGAAVLVELRGLFPEGKPLPTDEVLASLQRGDLVLGYLFGAETAALLMAGEESTSGAILAEGKEALGALKDLAQRIRASIADPPRSRAETYDAKDARELLRVLLPDVARARARSARRLVVLPDGPLNDIPMEALIAFGDYRALEDKPVVYAASAAVYLRRRDAPKESEESPSRKLSALVLGDCVYERSPIPEPKYPDKGALIAAALPGGNAASAGLRRGDVLLAYDGRAIEEPASLSRAIAEVSDAIQGGKRAASQLAIRYFRDGEEKEAKVKPGKLGVQVAQGDPASALRSMARAARGLETLAAEGSAADQVRLFGEALKPLPGTRREALAILEIALGRGGEALGLLGEEATVGKLTAAASGKRFLHLATHGLRGSVERPYDAGLALTRPREVTPQDIGFLRLEDLLRNWRGKLEGTDLVVLSACETQRGAKVGESAMALPWGFFYAGARTVVASLWKVDDEATSLLMVRFYENLLGAFTSPRRIGDEEHAPGKGMLPEPALREARAWLRSLSLEGAEAERRRISWLAASAGKGLEAQEAGMATPEDISKARGPDVEVDAPVKGQSKPSAERPSDRPYAHPYYWAAFVCVGGAR